MSCDVKWLAHCSLTRMLLTHRDSRALCTVWTATMAELWGQPIKLAREETRLALVDELLFKNQILWMRDNDISSAVHKGPCCEFLRSYLLLILE